MNERIRKLAEQAMIFSHENGGWRISTHVPNDFQEKFAELIVRECAKVGGDFEYTRLHDSLVEDHILKHFGVE